MQQGRVAQAGTPQSIYDAPVSPFVAAFVAGANVLSGCIRDGRAAVGAVAVDVPEGAGAEEGGAVHAFVRPHEVKLSRTGDGAPHVAVARVERLAYVGSHVKVCLRLPDGSALTVEVGNGEMETLNIQEGDRVMADLREARIFLGDYAI
jgi:sulfate transport system ATP-binding protein